MLVTTAHTQHLGGRGRRPGTKGPLCLHRDLEDNIATQISIWEVEAGGPGTEGRP